MLEILRWNSGLGGYVEACNLLKGTIMHKIALQTIAGFCFVSGLCLAGAETQIMGFNLGLALMCVGFLVVTKIS